MSYIVDKLILLLLSAVLLAGECSVKELIVLSLLGVISACINTYFDKKSIAVSAGILYLITILMVPKAVLMAGVILYDLYAHKLYVLEGVTGLLLVGLIGNVSVRSVIMLIVISLLAHLLFRRSRKLEGLELQLNKIRDDSYEKNLFLMDKNKHLIESQDQEVYVATLKERNRIAREIHDNVGHMLTRSILQMGALMTIYKEEPLHGQLESVKNNLDIAMNNIRESVHDLHDESIDLKASIEDLLNELRGNFACKLDYDISKTIDRKYKYAIIGIVREAVSNIIKHGKGDTVEITVREHPGMYQLVIHDYESGSLLNTSHSSKAVILDHGKGEGIGLQNMQDRVTALNGNISIDTSYGYRIFVTFPKEKENGR